MTDILLQKFFEKNRWESAIDTAVEKGIDKSLLRQLCTPEERVRLYRSIRDGEYHVQPPHEAQVPKDDGTMRTVYVNEGVDRVILSILNDMLFELMPEMVHPRCGSYQKGIGCGRLVIEMSEHIAAMETPDIGVKVDLSKYFDSVPLPYIEQVFDKIEQKFGQSALMKAVREYYRSDTVIDLQKNTIHKYTSLKQGCAVAAFLADAVLYDIDEKISGMDVQYVRYSDDILIIGDRWQPAFQKLSEMLTKKGLTLNPKKIEFLSKDRWFSFLGFSVKGDSITLSPHRVKDFQKEIEKRTIKKPGQTLEQAVRSVNQFLYKGNGKYSWATSVLPIVNVGRDIAAMNGYVMDAVRASVLGRSRIGGLGFDRDGKDHAIQRGTGRNMRSNKERLPMLAGYKTISCMQKAMLASREAYRTIVIGM